MSTSTTAFSTRFLLSSALGLTAVSLFAARPAPKPPGPPPVATSPQTGSPVHVALRGSQGLVSAVGGETWAEVEVWLDESAKRDQVQPVSVALLLDRSGSMAGEKIVDARRAAHRLVDQLGEQDDFALVTFSSHAHSTGLRRMDALGKALMHLAIEQAEASGGTNISEGLTQASAALVRAKGGRRLVLVTDGHPTEGQVLEAGLAELVSGVRRSGVTVSALGVGADYDGLMMQHLAERGGGMYGYLASPAVLEEVLTKELDLARHSMTQELVVTLEGGEGVLVPEVAGRLPLQVGRVATLELPELQAGEHLRVFARVVTPVAQPGSQVPLRATARWSSQADQTYSATTQLELRVSEDAGEVANSKNGEVFERSLSAFASTHLVAAAAAYERGDSSAGESLLGNARALFGMSAQALAGDAEVSQVRHMANESVEARRSTARGLEKKLLVNFGNTNEGY